MLVAGDFCPHNRTANINCFDWKDCFDSSIRELISFSDFSLMNLECPVKGKNSSPIFKQGPNLCCEESAISFIKELGISGVTLANNHFRDYGDVGVASTIMALQKCGLQHVGGGINKQEAQQPLIVEFNTIKVAFVNFCENEFSIASETKGGAAPLDDIELYGQITQLKSACDRIIVISHGGHEHYQLPSPRMRKLFRWLIDIGADVVINHHQHCYSGYEVYNRCPIFYGLGNFFFDWDGQRSSPWNYGYMVELEISDDINFNIIPYSQCDIEPVVRSMTDQELVEFNRRIVELNEIISDYDVLRNSFEEYCRTRYEEIRLVLSPYTNRYANALCRRRILPAFDSPKRFVKILNNIDCESRRDVLLDYLKEFIQ